VREYGKVFSQFWSSDDVRSMTEDARTLALYLLTCQHGTIAGVFPLPNGYICEDMKWKSERVSKGFQELSRKGWASRCEATNWVWIGKHFEWNAPENPNQWKAARKIVDRIPEKCVWRYEFLRLFARVAGDPPPPEPEPSAKGSETVSKSVSESGTEAVAETEAGTNTDSSATPPDVQRGTDLKGQIAARVFGHWCLTWEHPRAKLDRKRRTVIRSALDMGYSEDDLNDCISGYRNSPYHMGQNEQNTVYDNIATMLKDGAHIDRGIGFHRNPPRTDLSPKTRQAIDQTSGWVPPEMRHAAG